MEIVLGILAGLGCVAAGVMLGELWRSERRVREPHPDLSLDTYERLCEAAQTACDYHAWADYVWRTALDDPRSIALREAGMRAERLARDMGWCKSR